MVGIAQRLEVSHELECKAIGGQRRTKIGYY